MPVRVVKARDMSEENVVQNLKRSHKEISEC